MEAYGRAYLYLLHGAVRALRAEAFVFATRLHRLTRQLRTTQPAVALAAAMAATPDWSGGTRSATPSRRSTTGGPAAGWPVAPSWSSCPTAGKAAIPPLLGREMERLARLAHRIVWVNPRLQSPQFRPLTGGMAAALPHVDDRGQRARPRRARARARGDPCAAHAGRSGAGPRSRADDGARRSRRPRARLPRVLRRTLGLVSCALAVLVGCGDDGPGDVEQFCSEVQANSADAALGTGERRRHRRLPRPLPAHRRGSPRWPSSRTGRP